MTSQQLDCVIVAGGLGTRMRPLTLTVPKSLLPVGDWPVVDHQLSWLGSQAVRRVVLCLGHQGDAIERHARSFAATLGLEVVVSHEGDAALGTAGAVKLAIDRGLLVGRFLTLYGDTIPTLAVPDVLGRWTQADESALLCVYPAEPGSDDARALVVDGMVRAFERHPSPSTALLMTHGDYGVAGFDTEHFAHLTPRTRSGFGTIHSNLATRGLLHAYSSADPPIEVGTHESYARAQPWHIDGQGAYTPTSSNL